MDDLDIAIHLACKRYGIGRLAGDLAMRESAFRNKIDPNDSHHLSPHELLAVLVKTEDTQVMDFFAQKLGGKFATRDNTVMDNVLTAVLGADCEYGDVAKAVQEALLNDGKIDGREAIGIRIEITQVRKALDVLENTIADLREQEGG